MNLYVFRSLPLNADSRIIRNLSFLGEEKSYSCTWEKKHFKKESENTVNFPFEKSGNVVMKVLKYLLFLFWIPSVVMTRTKKSDVIIFMDLETILFGGFVAKLIGATVVFDIVDPFSQTKRIPRKLSKIVDFIEYQMSKLSDILMVPHESRLQYYSDTISVNIKHNKIFIVENVPSYEGGAKVARDKKNMTCTIGYFGTLDFLTRGLERLVALAVNNSKLISVIIAGQGAMEQEISDISGKYNNITFLGGFSCEDLPLLYQKVDFTWAYYCPEIVLHRYAAPNKFYEHLYFNVPIITSSIIPQSDLIRKLNSGVFVDLSSDSDLEIIDKLFEFFDGRLVNNRDELFDYWSSNYKDYYKNKNVEFRKLLAEVG